jgi:predicted permease
MPKYAAVAARQQFYDRTAAEIEALPGVTRAAFISFLPMVWRGGIWPVGLDGREPDPVDARVASLRYVTPGFFQSMGIPLKSGRDIADSDREGAASVAVVSQSFVDQNWPGQNPLGRQFFIAFRHRTVVGVAGSIRVRGLERESEPQVYIPSGQIEDGSLLFFAPKNLVVSAAVPVTTLVGSIRRIVASADAELPLDVRLLSDIVADETAPRRAQVGVLAGFAGVAFLLAGVGIHGLLAFAVSSRTREIGLRMAIGARSGEIAALVLGRALKLALAGGILGLALGVAAGQTLRAILAGISPLDPAVYTSALALTSLMTLLGCLIPAIRAVRVDPIVTIRSE